MNAPSRQPFRLTSTLGFSAVLVAAAWPGVARGGYNFHTIVNNQDVFIGLDAFTEIHFQSAQGINDGGEVAFFATKSTIGSGDMYKGSGGGVTLISTDGSHFVDSQFTGSINEGGSVAFRGDYNGFQGGIYSGSGDSLTSVIYEGNFDPQPRWLLTGAATINDSDAVAFHGGRRNFPGQAPDMNTFGVHVVTGGMVATLVEVGAVYEGASGIPPAFNDAGQAAFTMRAVADGTFHILHHDGSSLMTIDTGYSFGQQLSMNAEGDVAFVDQDLTAVKVYRDGSIETIASTTDGFDWFQAGNVFINDAGEMAFEGSVSEFEGDPVAWNGVFTGTDLVNDRILIVGDSLFGRTVDTLDLLGFNNAGQILMSVGLTGPGNWQGLIVATPPLDGDFDEDTAVDGDDLADWETGFGIAGTAVHGDGDADSDEDVDGDDFLVWQRQLGSGVPMELAAPVPEPSTAALIIVVAAGAVLRRLRRHY